MKNISPTLKNNHALGGKLATALISALLLFLVSLPLSGPADAAQVMASIPASFASIVKKASPSVVFISTERKVSERDFFGQNDQLRDFFQRFFGNRIPRNLPPQKALGTGFIIDKNGYILTNNHVVAKADEIKVKLEDGRKFKARIIGRDPDTDLALIKIDGAKNLVPLELGNSDKLQVGDWVIAIGNPFGLGHTVTAGIVSAKYRNIDSSPFDSFIQTDAPINPGNSGGPLMNIEGQVVGINSAILSQTGENIGIGFAIPINMAKQLLPMLKKGKVVRAWLGAWVQGITPALKDKLGLKSDKGALIADITKGGPSAKAGLKRLDVIISFQGKEIKDWTKLPFIVSSTPVGTKAKVVVIRDGKKKTFYVKLGVRPESEKTAEMNEPTKTKLGMELETLTPEVAKRYGISSTKGLLVLQVEYNSPAADAGLRQGDVILQVDQHPVSTVPEFDKMLQKYKPGETMLLLVKQGENTIYMTLKVGKE